MMDVTQQQKRTSTMRALFYVAQGTVWALAALMFVWGTVGMVTMLMCASAALSALYLAATFGR